MPGSRFSSRSPSAAICFSPAAHRFTLPAELTSGLRRLGERTVAPGGEPTGDGPAGPVLLRMAVEPAQPFAALLDEVRELAAELCGEDDPLVHAMVVPDDAPAFPADLVFRCTERPGVLEFAVEYNAELFDAAAAERLAGHLAVLLHAAVDDPARPVFELPLLTGAQRHTVVVDWNDTASDYPAGQCVPELFAEHAPR